jgi:hypothetical protein
MPATSDVVAAPAIGEEAAVADAMEAVRQAVQKKAAAPSVIALNRLRLPGNWDI